MFAMVILVVTLIEGQRSQMVREDQKRKRNQNVLFYKKDELTLQYIVIYFTNICN